MRNLLSALHNPDNGSLRFIVAVCGYTLVSLLIFGFGLLSLYLIDLDAVFRVGEVDVHGESIINVDIFTFGVFAEHSIARTG